MVAWGRFNAYIHVFASDSISVNTDIALLKQAKRLKSIKSDWRGTKTTSYVSKNHLFHFDSSEEMSIGENHLHAHLMKTEIIIQTNCKVNGEWTLNTEQKNEVHTSE